MQVVGRRATNTMHHKSTGDFEVPIRNLDKESVYSYGLVDLTIKVLDQSWVRPDNPLVIAVAVSEKTSRSAGQYVIDSMVSNVLVEPLVEFRRIIVGPDQILEIHVNTDAVVFARAEYIYDPYVIKAGTIISTGASNASLAETPLYIANDPLISHFRGHVNFSGYGYVPRTTPGKWTVNAIDLGKLDISNEFASGYIKTGEVTSTRVPIQLLKDERLHVSKTGGFVTLHGLVMSTVKNSRLGE